MRRRVYIFIHMFTYLYIYMYVYWPLPFYRLKLGLWVMERSWSVWIVLQSLNVLCMYIVLAWVSLLCRHVCPWSILVLISVPSLMSITGLPFLDPCNSESPLFLHKTDSEKLMSVLSNDFCRRCIYVGAFPEVKKNRLQFVKPQPCNSGCPNFKGKVNSEKHLGTK